MSEKNHCACLKANLQSVRNTVSTQCDEKRAPTHSAPPLGNNEHLELAMANEKFLIFPGNLYLCTFPKSAGSNSRVLVPEARNLEISFLFSLPNTKVQ